MPCVVGRVPDCCAFQHGKPSTAAPVLSPWTAAWGSSDYQRFQTIGNWKSRDHILSPINPFRSRTNQRCAPSSACPAPGPPLESRRQHSFEPQERW